MTVCVGVKVRDCIVFAADSAVSMMTSTSSGEPIVANVWNHGIKVYNLHKKLPIVAMSAGAGNLGSASISEVAKYLRSQFTLKGSSQQIKPTELSDGGCGARGLDLSVQVCDQRVT